MWNSFIHWIHHLFNPHCEQCAIEYKCESCEILQQQLAIQNENNRQLTLSIVEMNKPVINTEAAIDVSKLKLPNRKHWRAKQAELEQASRDRAVALRSAAQPDEEKITISTLEKELEEVEKARANAQVN